MTIISIDKELLQQAAYDWGVPDGYVSVFCRQCVERAGRVLIPFVFNAHEHQDNQRHWLAFNAAMWCCVYREAQTKQGQGEALGCIRALFYVAQTLGEGEIKKLLWEWWSQTYELHRVPAPDFSAVQSPPIH
ncbi:hypothetical protein [Citrobacter gillenii]|uniref:hypothetical protein n=1 Tax=Citrobacter gillenii TaxID=67828 RepID=UPI0022E18676|nr:hypothetical protein [Citrobacter gillenii]